MKDNTELRISVVPNAIIRKHFTMRNIGGKYRIMENKTGRIIYENGKCCNCGTIDIVEDGVIIGLAIRSIAYVLRWDNNNCDYHMFNIVTPYGSSPEEKRKNLRCFNVDDIKCYSRGRVEWKFLPKVKDIQWSVRDTKAPKITSEQVVMDFIPTPTNPNSSKTWEVEINGTTFSFKDKESMIEMCKNIAR